MFVRETAIIKHVEHEPQGYCSSRANFSSSSAEFELFIFGSYIYSLRG